MKQLVINKWLNKIIYIALGFGLFSCGSDDGNEEGAAVIAGGFHYSEIGVTTALISIHKKDLKKKYLNILSKNEDSFLNLGLDDQLIDELINNCCRITYSDDKGLGSESRCDEEIRGDSIYYSFICLNPNSQCFYRINWLCGDGTYQYEETNSFMMKPFDKSNISFVTGDAEVSHNSLNYYNIRFEDTTIDIRGITQSDYNCMWYGILMAEKREYLTESNAYDITLNRKLSTIKMTSNLFGEDALYHNGVATLNFSRYILWKFEESTYYYCPYLEIGNTYYLGEIKSVTKKL